MDQDCILQYQCFSTEIQKFFILGHSNKQWIYAPGTPQHFQHKGLIFLLTIEKNLGVVYHNAKFLNAWSSVVSPSEANSLFNHVRCHFSSRVPYWHISPHSLCYLISFPFPFSSRTLLILEIKPFSLSAAFLMITSKSVKGILNILWNCKPVHMWQSW